MNRYPLLSMAVHAISLAMAVVILAMVALVIFKSTPDLTVQAEDCRAKGGILVKAEPSHTTRYACVKEIE
jgi:hypothetical protein